MPPRPVTSYFAVLMVCSAPRVVSTVSRSRSPLDAMNPSTRSSLPSLIRMTPLPGPDRKFTSSALQSMPRASAVAAIRISPPVTRRDADDLGAFGRPREAPAGARARLDEPVEPEAQRVAVARHGDGVHRRRSSPSFFGAMLPAARGSRLSAATIFSPSFSLNCFWIGSP